jgi:uncharacterized cofD-like protein
MTQPGETDGYSVRDHVQALLDHGCNHMIDMVLVNESKIPAETRVKYEAEGSESVFLTEEDIQFLDKMGIGYLAEDFIQIEKGYVKHDALKIAEKLVGIVDTKIYHKNLES